MKNMFINNFLIFVWFNHFAVTASITANSILFATNLIEISATIIELKIAAAKRNRVVILFIAFVSLEITKVYLEFN